MNQFDDIEYDGFQVKTWAKKVKDNQSIHADDASKCDGPFYCPETSEELIVRHCREKVNHFAYKGRLSPTITKAETELHKSCKKEICEALLESIPDGNWEIERQNLVEDKQKNLRKVIPDISGRITAEGHVTKLIIEIQASVLSINEIIKRTVEYTKRGGHILWVLPLTEELGNEDFRPRLFERYLHEMYFGRTYYWVQGSGRFLIPVHYTTSYRTIEETTWIDEFGDERNEGGYEKAYRRIKKPLYGELVDIATNFHSIVRPEFTPINERMKVPPCNIFKDNLKQWW